MHPLHPLQRQSAPLHVEAACLISSAGRRGQALPKASLGVFAPACSKARANSASRPPPTIKSCSFCALSCFNHELLEKSLSMATCCEAMNVSLIVTTQGNLGYPRATLRLKTHVQEHGLTQDEVGHLLCLLRYCRAAYYAADLGPNGCLNATIWRKHGLT